MLTATFESMEVRRKDGQTVMFVAVDERSPGCLVSQILSRSPPQKQSAAASGRNKDRHAHRGQSNDRRSSCEKARHR